MPDQKHHCRPLYTGDRWPSYLSLRDSATKSVYTRDPDWRDEFGDFSQSAGAVLEDGMYWRGDNYGGKQYESVNYWGLRQDKSGWFIVTRLWIPVNNSTGKRTHVGNEVGCVFYFARKYEYKGFLRGFRDKVEFEQYGKGNDQNDQEWGGLNGYNVKTTEQMEAWLADQTAVIPSHASAGRERGGGSGKGGKGKGGGGGLPKISENPEIKGIVSRKSSGEIQAEEARAIFIQAQSGGSHWHGKFTKEREAMQAIADRITASIPVFQRNITGGDQMLKASINKALTEAGYTPSQMVWFHNGGITNPLKEGLGLFQLGSKTGDSFSPGGKSSTPPAPKVTPPTPAVTKIKVRAPIGYTQPAGRGADMRPHIAQIGSGGIEDRYYFHNIPNAVSYQGLGSRWVEVPRKGDFPIVEWSDWALMKVSFDFLVAHEHDGFYTDVAEEIEQLRRMAQRPLPVSVFGMDQLFEIQMLRASRSERAMQFVIANFTVKSARRVAGEGNKEIAAAQCSMTLQEIPIEEMKVVEMSLPPLTGPDLPSEPSDGPEASSPYMLDAHPSVQQIGEENLMDGPVVIRED